MTAAGVNSYLSSVRKCRRNEPGSISGDNDPSAVWFSKLSADLQRVSRAECSESMAYKNWAVNPQSKSFTDHLDDLHHVVLLVALPEDEDPPTDRGIPRN